MSFGCAPSDIALGLQMCKWIWDNCFDKNNSADERYRQFGNDVKGLESRLIELQRALDRAIPRLEHPEEDAMELQKDINDLVGDFNQTLRQCREVLEKHVKLRKNRAKFIQNIMWAATAQDKVDTLRRRIQFHSQKIYLIMEQASLGLLTNIDTNVNQVLKLIRAHFNNEQQQTLESVPDWLDDRFRETVMENAPNTFTELGEIPLKESFDALWVHFRASTYAFRDRLSGEQTAEQYLNLLKCQWLVEVIRQGGPFTRAHPGSLYPRSVAQVEQRILAQHRRTELVYFEKKQLIELNETAFLIWPLEQITQVRFLTDPDVGDEEILKLSCLPATGGTQRDGLVLFRTGPTTLKIVRSVIPDRSGTPYFEMERFNIHLDRFIPYYAMHEAPVSGQSVGSNPLRSVEIYRGNETGGSCYEIPQEKDMLNFQRAITGYQVVADMNTVWALNIPGFIRPEVRRGKGRLQIWLYKPLSHEQSERRDSVISNLSGSPTTSHTSMITNITTNAVVDRVLQGRDRNSVSIHEGSENQSTIGVRKQVPPVIIIYVPGRDDYTYLHIELILGIQIAPTSCDCVRHSRTCRRSVLESPTTFLVRQLTVPTEALNTWNLAIFAHPGHPLLETITPLKCKFLDLVFPTVDERMKFTERFNKALSLRDQDERAYRRLLSDARWMAERPNQTEGRENLQRGIRTSLPPMREQPMMPVPAEPPVLRPMPSFESLNMISPGPGII